jgi:transposase
MQRAQRRRRSFSKEFKLEAVRLVASSNKTVADVARDLNLVESTLRGWMRHAQIEVNPQDRLTTTQRKKLAQLSQRGCGATRRTRRLYACDRHTREAMPVSGSPPQ